MCFSEKQSFINAIILIIGSIFVYPKYRLSIFLIFLALKDLIQGFLYKYQHNEKLENSLTVLSWIHICFQPLFVNIFISYFSENKYNNYWNIIFIICLLYGIYTLTTLKEFDIQNDPDCIKIDKKDDFCSKYTTSYIGKYHVAYKFNRDNDLIFFPIIYLILMFVPSLFTNCRILGIIWGLFVILIYIYFNNIGNGEKAAIWCFLSIIYFLPIAIFNKQISKFLF
tara:strand:- start:1963 stop:2637 length:675 start_codon:yes stop_codon:yes gene_type:complete